MFRIVIVGGGVSGLTLAYRLEQRLPAAEVVVLEQRPRLGGKVDTLCRDGFRVEAGPNGFLDTNPATLDLCRELGLGDRLTAASEAAGRNRFLLLDGRLRMLPGKSVCRSWPAACSAGAASSISSPSASGRRAATAPTNPSTPSPAAAPAAKSPRRWPTPS